MADAPPHKPPTRVELLWEHDLVFAASSGSVRTTLDSASLAGQSPMQALAFGSLPAACRWPRPHPPQEPVEPYHGAQGGTHRPSDIADPHRFVSVDLHFTVIGSLPPIKSSAPSTCPAKCCSVWHSMPQDIELNVTFEVVTAV